MQREGQREGQRKGQPEAFVKEVTSTIARRSGLLCFITCPDAVSAFIYLPLSGVQRFSFRNLASTLRISQDYILLLSLDNMKILYANLLLVATCHAQASADYRYGRNNANTTVLGDFNVTWTPDEVSQPNATRKVSFEPWTGGIPQNWTWTLAMSELAFADLSLDEPDSRVALTTYTFEWPQGGNVSNTITPSRGNTTTGEKQCIYHFFVNFMPNVSSAWDSDSARCASAIGTECEQYLVSRRWLDPLNDDCIPPTGSSGSGRMAQCMDYMPVGGSVAGYRKPIIRRKWSTNIFANRGYQVSMGHVLR
jgi:hypothetical protein